MSALISCPLQKLIITCLIYYDLILWLNNPLLRASLSPVQRVMAASLRLGLSSSHAESQPAAIPSASSALPSNGPAAISPPTGSFNPENGSRHSIVDLRSGT